MNFISLIELQLLFCAFSQTSNPQIIDDVCQGILDFVQMQISNSPASSNWLARQIANCTNVSSKPGLF